MVTLPSNLLPTFYWKWGVFRTSRQALPRKEIARKTNEILELRNLLSDVDITGKVVTADALHTRRATARFLVEDKKADDLFTAVKGDQRKLRDALTCLPWGDFSPQR